MTSRVWHSGLRNSSSLTCRQPLNLETVVRQNLNCTEFGGLSNDRRTSQTAASSNILGTSKVQVAIDQAMGKMRNCGMRNAESKMWNQKCGMTLIGRGDKPRDRWLSTDYHTSLSTDSAVKCRPEVRKSLAMEADSVS